MADAAADFIDTYVISLAEMKTCLLSAGSRANSILAALSPYAAGTPDIPVAQADWADTYTLDTAAKVNAVLAAAGPRGWSFMTVFLDSKAA